MHVQAARDELMELLMAAAQRRAEAAVLDFGYASEPDGDTTKWTLQVDGHGFRIAAWSHQLERDLPTVAEGYPHLPAHVAIGFANSIVARWFADCVGTSGDQDDTPEAVIADDGGVNRWWWPILAARFKDLSDETRQRLAQADWLVGRWIVGELPVETIIEEVHPIAEAVLQTATASGPKARWPQLVKAAREKRMLTFDDVDVLTRFSASTVTG